MTSDLPDKAHWAAAKTPAALSEVEQLCKAGINAVRFASMLDHATPPQAQPQVTIWLPDGAAGPEASKQLQQARARHATQAVDGLVQALTTIHALYYGPAGERLCKLHAQPVSNGDSHGECWVEVACGAAMSRYICVLEICDPPALLALFSGDAPGEVKAVDHDTLGEKWLEIAERLSFCAPFDASLVELQIVKEFAQIENAQAVAAPTAAAADDDLDDYLPPQTMSAIRETLRISQPTLRLMVKNRTIRAKPAGRNSLRVHRADMPARKAPKE